MLSRFDESYQRYIERTGMFLPLALEHSAQRKRQRRPLTVFGGTCILSGLLVLCVGGGFALRASTVRHLPLVQGGVDVEACVLQKASKRASAGSEGL